MTREKYRGDGRSWTIFLMIMLAGVAGQIATLFLLDDYTDQLQFWLFPISAVPFVAALILAVTLVGRYDRSRVDSIARALDGYSMTLVYRPSPDARQHFAKYLEPFADRLGLKDGVANVDWIAYRADLIILEHSYTTGSGRSTEEHVQTVVAWLRSNEDLPGLQISSRGELYARKMRIGEGRWYQREWGDDLTVGDEEFEGAWRVYGNAEMAEDFFTEHVERLLIPAPRGETWWLAHGDAVVSVPVRMRADSLISFLQYTQQVLSATARS